MTETKRTKYQKFEAIEVHRSQLHGAPYNPRGLSDGAKSRLKRGIKKHGIVDTLVYNVRTGNLVGGHQRLKVLDELEGTDDYTLTVQQIDVDENEEMLLNMALNNPSLQGHFESDLQRDLFAHLMDAGVDIEGAGYTTTDVQTMYPDIFATGALADQLDAEADIVNQIHEMNRVGGEYEQTFRDDMGLPPTKAMLDKQARIDAREDKIAGDRDPYPDDYDAEGGESSWADVAESDTTTVTDGGKDWMQSKDQFKADRQRTVNHNADVKAESDVLVSFVFQTKAQLLGFLKAYNLQEDKRYFDVNDVQAAFGVEL